MDTTPDDRDRAQGFKALKLPEGYRVNIVPRDALVETPRQDFPYAEVRHSYSQVKVIAAFVQLAFAITSLYHARVHQVAQFGYAAFGLTVTPYALMSFINLLAALAAPEFHEVYLVRSSVLEEAMNRLRNQNQQMVPIVGNLVETRVGPLDPTFRYPRGYYCEVSVAFQQINDKFSAEVNPPASRNEYNVSQNKMGDEGRTDSPSGHLIIPTRCAFHTTRHPVAYLCSSIFRSPAPEGVGGKQFDEPLYYNQSNTAILILVLSIGSVIGIVGGISRFQKGESTIAQRVWTMLWLGSDLWFPLANSTVLPILFLGKRIEGLYMIIFAVLECVSATSAIGGFVVVGKMLFQYGSCVSLSV